ncbi:putative transcriptional regulatory protein YJL206C-like protein 1 [Colletotrichum chlorophyti]|uniref:Putative transcriptional regulatory protein YJL206C-like protein 1 n=1 Tax=Colletotrichum chlorophyti TaxID=708187 RepID=A0A1Q8S5W7_9PEZI|nr:putative transcriptional regulatory protein YJL206C-like protein 1 [Colletotrichum chlorophyti]
MDSAADTQRTTQNSGIKVRRPRAARACDLCRAKKNKCDELYPCTYCKSTPQGDVCLQRPGHVEEALCTRQLEDQVRSLSALAESQSKARSNDDVASAATAPDIPEELSPDCGLLRRPSRSTTVGSPSNARSRIAAGQEVSGVNRHTRNVEFYGSSSSVALLSHVQRTGNEPVISPDVDSDAGTLLSNLHNPAFSSPSADPSQTPAGAHEAARSSARPITHYPQCRCFLQSFFSSIHYVHPILDKKVFFDRCEQLWSNQDVTAEPSSFVALYYSILSLGALIGVREDEPIDGIENLQWSRKFFDEAKRRCDQLGMVTDLEMVQCYFFLAKVCQNELNAHWAYMYVGLAVRTALAMGINREPGPGVKKAPAQLRAESRTWWPDTLGADLYHNRQFPVIGESDNEYLGSSDLVDPPSCAIIKCMVDYSKIIRSTCLGIYLPEITVPRTVQLAHQIDQDLQRWAESLPEPIRPTTSAEPRSLKSVKEAQWMKRQRLVLTMRFLNIRILLFGSILLTSSSSERASIPGSSEGIRLCLESAKQTIEIIYQTYQHHDFFRTWFYNTTYTVFAASMILVYITQEATEAEVSPLLKLVGMATEILETMDECVVALRSAKLLHRAIEKAEKKFSASTPTALQIPAMPPADAMLQLNHYWGPLNILDNEMDFGFAMQFADFEGTNSLFMALDDQRPM